MVSERTVDIGSGHILVVVTPDGSDRPSGVDVHHATPDGQPCIGWVPLDVPDNDYLPAERKWQVEAWEPLTLSPSLLCGCGDHGYIRDGVWVPA